MADPFNGRFMVPDAAPAAAPEPRGGLATEDRGGLSKFVGNVTKGIEKVMSHPLYARAWSGMVSGMAGDPMAGPRALSELRAAQAPSLTDELNRYRLRQMQRDEEQAEMEAGRRQRLAAAASDPRNYGETWAREYPEEAGKAAFTQSLKPTAQPALKAIMTPEGPQYVPADQAVGKAPYSPSLVEINGLDANQIANASRAERASFVEAMKPFESFDRARATLRNVRGMADEKGILPQQASQIIASDAMAALRPEALNEGDVARLTAVGLWNKVNAALGLPPQMTVDQLDTLAKMIEDKAREAEPKRQAIIEDGRFRAQEFGFNPRLILGEYATPGRAVSPAPAGAPAPPPGPPVPVRARQIP